jgi:hypothetical protein
MRHPRPTAPRIHVAQLRQDTFAILAAETVEQRKARMVREAQELLARRRNLGR